MKIAIIGAGLSGLTLADSLSKNNDVTIFEKSRGYGGRLCTRYNDDYQFDHGAQFFTAHSDEFREFLKDKDIKTWDARFKEINGNKEYIWSNHYVSSPKMSSICRTLGEKLNVKLNTKIEKIAYKNNDKWIVNDEEFDWLFMSIPSDQAIELLPKEFKYYQRISEIKMQGCFSLMLGFKEKLDLGFDAALVKDSDISWISVDSSKPGRNKGFSVLVNSTNSWADENIENTEYAKTYLYDEFKKLVNINKDADFIDIHRWRYANIGSNKDESYIDHNIKLGVCGDWCIKGRVESAFLSAKSLLRKYG